MLRQARVLLFFGDTAPAPAKVFSRTSDHYKLGQKGVKEYRTDGVYHARDDHAYHVPMFSANRENNRHTRHHFDRPNRAKPLENRVRCPWCHTYFNFTYEEYRRDPALQAEYKAHEDSHAPPPGWEPDPRPMTGKGVTQYDARHRFGWMLGEEW
eukprot:TRINITY_DN72740_c0_g1_i1.p2 TRINITY_DN72740_c0_g1~~TRINITY_DN72740_c0_g1_i1.p2  ORF type:complete len:154 (+),score=37.87 TRINITY_DN72740_c0_g1_i1:77-538(+)